MPKIIEVKARCTNPDKIRYLLQNMQADFKGLDHQIDTYFKVKRGRLKLREGKVENTLIHYHRDNQSSAKLSQVTLYHPAETSHLKQVLRQGLDVLVVIDKHREIYFIDNVKFHLDQVEHLGTFVEIEAIDPGHMTPEELRNQCLYFQNFMGILPQDLIAQSYSDLLMQLSADSEYQDIE